IIVLSGENIMMIQMSLPFALAIVLGASAVAQEINDSGKNSTYRGIPSPEITPRGKAGAQTDTKEPDYIEVTDESGEVFRMPTAEKVLKDQEAFEAPYNLTPFEKFATSRAFLFGRPFKEAGQYRGQ